MDEVLEAYPTEKRKEGEEEWDCEGNQQVVVMRLKCMNPWMCAPFFSDKNQEQEIKDEQ